MQMEFNFKKAANFIRSAAAQGAELVVLPEYQSVMAPLERSKCIRNHVWKQVSL